MSVNFPYCSSCEIHRLKSVFFFSGFKGELESEWHLHECSVTVNGLWKFLQSAAVMSISNSCHLLASVKTIYVNLCPLTIAVHGVDTDQVRVLRERR